MKLVRLPSLFLVAAVAAVACGKSAASPLTASTEFSITQAADSIPLLLGREAKVGNVYMALTDVPSESRCPRDVVCVWAGDAVASIVVHPPCIKEGCKAASIQLQLHTNLEPRSGEGWGHKVQLLALLPAPVTTKPIDRSQYVAWVRVTPQ